MVAALIADGFRNYLRAEHRKTGGGAAGGAGAIADADCLR